MLSFELLITLPQDLATVSTTNLRSQVDIKSFFSSSVNTDGDTTCVQGGIASCVDGQFDTSNGRCPPTQQCLALPSVNSSGTVSRARLIIF